MFITDLMLKISWAMNVHKHYLMRKFSLQQGATVIKNEWV
jgi:hypothetical protein